MVHFCVTHDLFIVEKTCVGPALDFLDEDSRRMVHFCVTHDLFIVEKACDGPAQNFFDELIAEEWFTDHSERQLSGFEVRVFPSSRLFAQSTLLFTPAGDKRQGFMPFPWKLVQSIMQTALSRFWTLDAESMSYDDNHCAIHTPVLMMCISSSWISSIPIYRYQYADNNNINNTN